MYKKTRKRDVSRSARVGARRIGLARLCSGFRRGRDAPRGSWEKDSRKPGVAKSTGGYEVAWVDVFIKIAGDRITLGNCPRIQWCN